MLDMRFIRSQPEVVKEAIRLKGEDEVDIDGLLERDERWREYLQELESLRAERNSASKEIGRRKQQGEAAEELIEAVRRVNDRIAALDETVSELERSINSDVLRIPNVPHPDVPFGVDEDDNVEVRRWKEPRSFSFEPKAHWDIGVALGVIDFEGAARIAGSRFNILRGDASRLSRALINFMLDLHVDQHGYEEIYPPFLVNRDCMVGTGQLPKFADDVFHVEKYDFFLIPTAEVPVTNLCRGQILRADDLPKKFTAYTPCFRSEAGASGRDTRGIIRQHQFDKVELVHYTEPEKSHDALEEIVSHAEIVLQLLDLPYRVVLMCTGDTGFGQAKKYDLDVWMPSYGDYVEISSVSNFTDFQARRSGIRFRRAEDSRPEFVHTLNGSGLGVGRTIAAVLENCQKEDGTVTVPEPLRPYMGGRQLIESLRT